MVTHIQVYDGDGMEPPEDSFMRRWHGQTIAIADLDVKAKLSSDFAPDPTSDIPLRFTTLDNPGMRAYLADANAVLMRRFLPVVQSLTIHCWFGFKDHVFDDVVILGQEVKAGIPGKGRTGNFIPMLDIALLVRWRNLKVIDTY